MTGEAASQWAARNISAGIPSGPQASQLVLSNYGAAHQLSKVCLKFLGLLLRIRGHLAVRLYEQGQEPQSEHAQLAKVCKELLGIAALLSMASLPVGQNGSLHPHSCTTNLSSTNQDPWTELAQGHERPRSCVQHAEDRSDRPESRPPPRVGHKLPRGR